VPQVVVVHTGTHEPLALVDHGLAGSNVTARGLDDHSVAGLELKARPVGIGEHEPA